MGGSVQFSLEGYNLESGKWTTGNLGKDYQEGDRVPHRLIIDNSGGADPYVVPSFTLSLDHYNNTKNAVFYDQSSNWGYVIVGSTASGDAMFPGGLTGISPSSHDVPNTKTAPQIFTTFPSGTLTVPAGQMGVVYFKGHLALTAYWNYYGPGIDGAGFYPGSSGQTRISMDGVGDKTVPLPSIAQPTGSITVVKFNDLNHNGVKDAGEDVLSGWTFHLSMVGGWPLDATQVTGADGKAVFGSLPGGSFSINEDAQSGWTASTSLPLSVSIAPGENASVNVGNYRPDVTKTFSLSISNLPAGATALVRYVIGGQTHELELTGSGPYTGSVQLPYGTTISSWTFYAKLLGGTLIPLGGSSSGETLTGSMTNPLRYVSSVSGTKFDDANANGVRNAGEAGLSGWTIQLMRVVGPVETLYAQTITGADGGYSFADVLPGVYKVYEVQQSGWFNTVHPVGTFTVSNGSTITGLDFGNVQVLSGISVTKTGPATAYVGDLITYTIVVSNAGNTPLHDVTVTDSMFGVLDTGLSLAVGESKTYHPTHTVVAGDPDPIPNTVDVLGFDLLGQPVTDQASHSVDILKPGISIVKTGPATAYVGDVITYTITVTNTGEETLYDVVASDPTLGWTENIGTMAAGESLVFHPTLTVTESTADPLPNTASVVGYDQNERDYNASDDHTVNIIKPSISILKTGPDYAYVGDTITYTITVQNNGEDPLYNVTAMDATLGWSQFYLVLQPGETHVYNVDYAVTAQTPDPLPNTVTVSGSDVNERTYSDEASHVVDILKPAISVTKSGVAFAHVGDVVQYEIVVTNTGEETLYGVMANDPTIGWSQLVGELAAGASATYTVPFTIGAQTPDPLLNTVTATGADAHEKEVSAQASHELDIIKPSISVVKTGPAFAYVGDQVTFTITVTNDGEDPLHDVVVEDTTLGWSQNIASLAPGASQTFQVQYTVTAQTPDPYVNTVTALGIDQLDKQVNDTATHEMDIVKPAISIVKTSDADPLGVPVGTSVTYTFLVKNIGEEPLHNIVVTDDKLGVINAVPFSLLPGEQITLTMSATLDASVVNVATVVGLDQHDKQVTASDDATVDVFLPFTPPDLALHKTADKSVAKPGDLVTYTLTITNVGAGASQGYTVVDDYDQRYVAEIIDPAGGTVDTAAGKITWAISDPLAPGATKTITYTVKLSADFPNGTTLVRNTAVVNEPTDENPGNNSDSWQVKVTVSEPFLPFTGADYSLLAMLAAMMALIGYALVRVARMQS